MSIGTIDRIGSADVAQLDPYQFMAVIGKRVIHPGGRHSSEALMQMAAFTLEQRVLDVGCGVGTTAVEIAHRYGSQVTAVDISPLMLQRAQANVRAAKLEQQVIVEQGDILDLGFILVCGTKPSSDHS